MALSRIIQGIAMADQVHDNAAKSRYELDVDGHVAFVDYRLRPDRILLVHTEVPSELGGRGVGSKLAKGTLDAVRARGLKAEIRCDFLDAYVKKHPEYADVVA
jgi:predicted GNAT family acetyltransferase